jgi:hypothetical protein
MAGMTWSSKSGFGGVLMSPQQQLAMMRNTSGGSSGGSGSMTLSQMLAMQREQNAQTKQQNIDTRQATLGVIGGVPTAFEGDPLWQATRQSAQRLVNDPEAINDQTQQLIQNRAANQTNAAANTSRDQIRRQMAAQGMLGSSAEQGAMGQLERDRMAGLADASTKLEIERASRRNQDILASQQMGAALAGQQSGVRERMAGVRAQTDTYWNPEDLSGYAGYFAGQGGGRAGGGFGFGLNNQGSTFGFNTRSSLNQNVGPMIPGQPGLSTYNYNNPGGYGIPQQSPGYFDNTNYQRYAQPSLDQQYFGDQYDSAYRADGTIGWM